MKKLFVLLLALAMTLALAACGGGEKPAQSAPPPATTPPASAAASSVAEPSAEDEAVAWEDILYYAYMGMSEASEYYYLGLDESGTFAVLCVLSESGDFVSFVGEAISNEDGSMTISDETSGLSLTFSAIEQEDGTIALDLGEELGYALIAACEISELADALNTIDAAGNAVA